MSAVKWVAGSFFFAGIMFVVASNMGTMEYGKYRLDSRPQQHNEVEGWIPFVSITWLEGTEWRSHNIENPDKVFETEEEALAFGFAAARLWINTER